MRDFGGELKRFSDMDDVQVSEDDPDVRGWDVLMPDGRDIGEVKDLLVDTDTMKVRALEVELDKSRFNWNDNRRVALPVDSVQIDDDDDNLIVSQASLEEIGGLPAYGEGAVVERTAAPSSRETSRAADAGRDRLTRSEEELRVGKREVPAGEVRVSKHVETEHISEEVPRQRERVRIERRPATGATASGARIENDEIRVPVTEEEVVVEKRPVVKEELVVSKETVSEPERVEADIKKERFDIDQEGHVLDENAPGRKRER